MATQIMQAMGPTVRGDDKMKPLPGLPSSPTLTNPDMVLPDHPTSVPSPPRNEFWRERPPSPSYLRDKTSEQRPRTSGSGSSSVTMTATPGKKEKRGLMSRKMMLLRSRTASSTVVQLVNGNGNGSNNTIPRSVPSEVESEDYGSGYASSPTLMDVGNLAPEQPEQRRMSTSGSSLGSDYDMANLPQFLAKYEDKEARTSTDDEIEASSPATQRYAYPVSIDDGLDAQRRQQEEEEQHSAILSKRAEAILANAKKRLNLMEGNLRGARDLVAPLTAANLKRATSVGSSYASPAASRGRFVHDAYQYEQSNQQPYRTLHAQASSPTMGRDFQGHWRGFSETEIPERPHTALDRTQSPIQANGRIPTKAHDPTWTNTLKGSRSYDSLGDGAFRRPPNRGSPDSNLEPLMEDDGQPHAISTYSSRGSDDQDGLGIYRSPSRTEDLREQMSSLKGRISSLKERAREDSLRRQSAQNLREPSPLNNAVVNAPEFFYTSSQAYGAPVLDTNAGIGRTSQDNSPATPQEAQRSWEPAQQQQHHQVVTGSRNAFAEQAQRRQRNGYRNSNSEGSSQKTQSRKNSADVQQSRKNSADGYQRPQSAHRRTPSGTAIVQSSRHRYSHHQYYHVRGDSRESNGNGVVEEDQQPEYGDDEYSEAGASVYEDAEQEPQDRSNGATAPVAHEDREDAFDYEHFFLHSAMSTYADKIQRRASESSEDSLSSIETARGPTRAEDGSPYDEEALFDESAGRFQPSTPETPEKLREIERNLHKRTFSDESVSTLATFATATEGRDSPPAGAKRSSTIEWPIPSTSRPNSRPSTAIPIKRPSPIALSDSSSERADSGIGGSTNSARPASSGDNRRHPAPKAISIFNKGATGGLQSPPMSPRTIMDPATVAVNALLETPSTSGGKVLGLKDKAVLFGVVESLRKVCRGILEDGEEGWVMRRRLEEVRRVLDGGN